jgi:hypothetical protein
MKTTAAIIVAAAIIVTGAPARGGDNVITNYFPGYVYVPASSTNSGTTGLTVSNAYLCIPAALLSVTATEAATATGDVRAVVYALNQQFYTARQASTNQTVTTITRGTAYAASGTNVLETVTHIIRTIRQFGAAALP